MKFLAQRIRQIVSGRGHTLIRQNCHTFDYIHSRRGILRELIIGKESGNLVGLISPALGEGIFLIFVISIELHNTEEVIAFQKYDLSVRRSCSVEKLSIRDIKGVCSFFTRPQSLEPA